MFSGSHTAQRCPRAPRGQRAQPQSLTRGLGTMAQSGLLSADARAPGDLRAAQPRLWLTRTNERRSGGGDALSSSGSRAGPAPESVEWPPPPGPGPEMARRAAHSLPLLPVQFLSLLLLLLLLRLRKKST